MIHGEIIKILTQKDNDWGRYRIKTAEKEIVAVGIIPSPGVGMTVLLDGYEEDTKYGHQFHVTHVLSSEASPNANMQSFFDLFVCGIGPSKAHAIISKYGDQSIQMFLSEQGKTDLCKIKGITENIINKAVDSIEKNKKYLDIVLFLNGSCTKHQIYEIYKMYGEESKKILQTNPYRLQLDLGGFGFLKVDKLALASGVKPGSVYRIMAAAKYALEQAQGEGHCFLPVEEVRKETLNLLAKAPTIKTPNNGIVQEKTIEKLFLNFEQEAEEFQKKYNVTNEIMKELQEVSNIRPVIEQTLEKALTKAIEEQTLVFENGKLYTPKMYEVEKNVASMMIDMLEQNPIRFIKPETIERAISDIEAKETAKIQEKGIDAVFGITNEQRKAVYTGVMNRLSIISGGPGRGKTTILAIIAHAFLLSGNYNRDDVVMLAPTGRAAQRITESTGYPSMTAHRAVIQAKRNPIKNKLVICDESSMCDIFLTNDILKFAKNCNLIFVGDVYQIASVGPGKVLKDMIDSGVVPYVLLTEGHRNTGNIAHNAELINEGKTLNKYAYGVDFQYFPTSSEIANIVVTDFIKMVEKYGVQNVMLCSPMRDRGNASVNKLNAALQKVYAERQNVMGRSLLKTKASFGSRDFYVGDRVMQTRNNYDFKVERAGKPTFGIFNGERGTVSDVTYDSASESYMITVTFDDGSVGIYDKGTVSELVLAYATTLHKCQGSEAECMMIVHTYADYMLLNRSLFYTGVTRAKKELRLYGEERMSKFGNQIISAFDVAVRKTNDLVRNTSLKEYLQNYQMSPQNPLLQL